MAKRSTELDEMKYMLRRIRDNELEITELQRQLRSLKDYVGSRITETRTELDELMPLYKHLKIRDLPEGVEVDDHAILREPKGKSIRPNSQMEFDTWRLEAMIKKNGENK